MPRHHRNFVRFFLFALVLLATPLLVEEPCQGQQTPAAAAPAKPDAAKAEAQPPEAKSPEAKPAAAKPVEAKPPEVKSEPKAEPKPQPKPESKPAEASPAAAKPSEPKPAAKPEPKPSEAKPVEAKPEPKVEAKPAEPKPAAAKPETKPAEPKPIAKPAPLSGRLASYALLGRPSYAERVKLTEPQRAQIAAILAERAAAMEKAAEKERPAAIQEAEKKLAAVLTPEQQAEWAKVPAEPLLRFNFRYQKWLDVLEWLAKQADLSLVVDHPPEGTFNYADTREFTPTEAIDLLNGVLLTKSYTLIRRERMLVVVDLADGIPENLVPRVPLEETDTRGKFELVTVDFPLAGRPAKAVSEEIKPLLGPHHKLLPIASTGQLRVTDTAGVMRSIDKVIQGLPVPPKTPTPTPPETPVTTAYPLKAADPKTAEQVLKALLPATANLVVDAKSEQVHVHATPSQQALVKAVLEQMQTGAPAEKKPRLELYPVDELSSKQVMASLEAIVPGAKLTYDPKQSKLAAWATPAEHESIKAAMEKLAAAPTPESARQFEVYRLTKADPKTVLALLETLLPNAKLAADPVSKTLVAIASPGDQKAIKNLLAQLQPEKPAPDSPELRFYPIAHTSAANLLKLIESVAPKAQVTTDPAGKRLMVIASPSDHEVIKGVVEKYEKETTTPEKNKLVVYSVSATQRKRFEAVVKTLTAELQGLQVLGDSEPGELTIWAKPEQHKLVTELLEQLKAEAPAAEKFVLAVYPVPAADLTSVQTALKNLHPNVQAVADAKGGRLLVWAHPADQAAIKASLEQLQAPPPPEKQQQFESYAIHGADPTGLVTSLQTLAPAATIMVNAKAGRLIVWGTPAEQELIRKALEKLGRGTGVDQTPQLETYTLTKADPTTTLALLQGIVPEAKLSIDPQTKRLVALAVPADQKAIKTLLDQLQSKEPEDKQAALETYPIHGLDATALATSLQPVAPGAKLTVDAKAGRLLVWGTPDEQAAIKKALDKLAPGAAGPGGPQLEVYRLTKADPTTILGLLQGVVPAAKVTVDPQTKILIVIAGPEEQKAVRALLEQLQPEKPAPDAPEMRFYPLTQPMPASLVTAIQGLVPAAKVSLDAGGKRLTAVASPADHAILQAAIEQVEKVGQAEEKNRLVVYPVTPGQQKRLQAVVTTLSADLPGVQVIADGEPGQLSVWAKPSQHVVIAEVLSQLKREVPGAEKHQMAVYAIKTADPKSVLTVLQGLFPNAQFVLDARTRRIIVWTSPSEQETIRQSVEKLDSAGGGGDTQDKLMVYPVPDLDAATVVKMLQDQVPEMKLSADAKAGTILAWGRGDDHQAVARTLKQLQAGMDAGHNPQLVIYPLAGGDATAIAAVLKSLVPKATVTVDAKSGGLAATASPREHELIKAAVQQMSQKGPPETQPKLAVYSLETKSPYGVAAAIPSLKAIFPEAQFLPGTEPSSLVVWARPADHEAIKTAIDELARPAPPEKARRVVIYTIQSASPRASVGTLMLLRSMFPDAQFSVGAEAGKVIVWANPADHKEIQSTIDQVSQRDPPEKARRIQVYTLESKTAGGAAAAITLLTPMFPDAKFSAGGDDDQLVAWARPEDHKAIQEAIAQLTPKELADAAHKMVIYTVPIATSAYGAATGGAASAIPALTPIFPRAKFSVGPDPSKLVAWARPADQEAIKVAVEELSKRDPPEKARKVIIYTIESASARSSVATLVLLRSMFPDAQFSIGSDMSKVIVWARAEDHKEIKSAIDQMSQDDPPEKARRIQVYTLESTTAGGLTAAITLLTSMFPDAKFSAGTEADQLIAWARPEDHKAIHEAIAQLTPKEPADAARKMVIYTVPVATSAYGTATGGAAAAIAALTPIFPHAKFSVGPEPSKLVAWAKPADHAAIQVAVDELAKRDPPEKARKVVIYTIESASARASVATLSVLRSMFPDAQFSIGSDMSKVIVWARADDHKEIKSAIDQMSQDDPPEKARRIQVYALESTGPGGVIGAITLLTAMFPDAKFSAGAEADQLIAWARPEDHKAIKEAIGQLAQTEPGKERKAVVYSVEATSPTGVSSAIALLTTMFPQAKFSVGTEPGKLVAWARPTEHAQIKTTIEQLAQKDPPETARKIVTYTLESQGKAGLTGAITVLTAMFPDAKFSAGTEPGKLIAWARPADHKEIKTAVEELAKKEAPETARRMEVYQLESIGAPAAITLLAAAFPDAEFSAAGEPGKLIAWARPAEQEGIKTAIAQLSKKGPPESEPKPAVYDVDAIGASAASTILKAAFPEAQITVGNDPGKLTVLARPKDQELIRAMVEGLEREGAKGQQARVQMYRLKAADPAHVLSVLQGLFRTRLAVQLSLDERNNAIVAVAAPSYQETIRTLIDQVEKASAEDASTRLQTYSLEDCDSTAVMKVLGSLLDKQGPRPELSVDARSNQLVAIARPEQHGLIESTLKQLRGEERRMEILQLETVECYTAELAINRLFSEGGYLHNAAAPQVDADESTQQLFIRGTDKQFKKIRELLVKLGETNLAESAAGDSRRTRVVRFDGDLAAAVEEIERVWPKLRQNPIRIIKPAAGVSVQGRGIKEKNGRVDKLAAGEGAGENRTDTDPPAWRASEGKWRPRLGKPPGVTSPLPLAGEGPGVRGAGSGQQAAGSGQKEVLPGGKPVIVIPGDGSVTISSEDPEALRQFEELLRALAEQRGTVGRNYNIYLLRNAKAAEVAATIQRLFRTPGTGRWSTGVIVVPDERLNAVVAYAPRSDRQTVEALVKVLDSSQVPEALGAERLTLIPVKNTDARRIVNVLRDLYKTQAEGFSVEEKTNSLVVTAPPALVDEIRQVVERLDEAAGAEPARGLRVVPLQKTSAARMQKALNLLLQEQPALPRARR